MRRKYLLLQITSLILLSSYFLVQCNKAKKSDKDGELSTKPLEISDCKNLTTISIFETAKIPINNFPSYNPNQIPPQPAFTVYANGALTQFKYNGDLSGKPLASLPEKIGCIKSIIVLDLPSNRISELPESMGELHKLKKLDLRNNILKKLPTQFVYLQGLEELFLDGNSFAVFPTQVLKLKQLKKLFLCGKNTDPNMNIPEAIANLENLTDLCLPKISAEKQTQVKKWFTDRRKTPDIQFN
jgi:Leucine-rich repeat (LRR) protein